MENSAPVHGYYFRVLSRSSKGFAAVAYPVAYRSSGVMTFIINQEDVVREKDLGPDTEQVGRAVAAYPTDRGWIPADPP